MWPFSKKPKLPGIKRTQTGNFTFDITEEEQQEINKLFDSLKYSLKDHLVHPDFADTLAPGLTARGLANYATCQVMMAELPSQINSREECIKKALSSISKAYSIYQLPIYLYDLACCLEMMINSHDQAKNTFELFLKRQSEYKPEPLDDIFMQGRDIDDAMKDAATKLRGTAIDEQEELASEIIDTSLVCGQSFFETNSSNKSEGKNLGVVVSEFIYFFMHVINRLAYSKGGKKAQEAIYNTVINHVGDKLVSKNEPDERREFIEIFSEGIIETEQVYAKCNGFVAEGGETMANTLLWEAAKRICQSKDIAEIMVAAELISVGLQTLKLDDKIELIFKKS
ncbi:MAG: hypothetical protein ACYCY7_04025 [Gallionella sp.]